MRDRVGNKQTTVAVSWLSRYMLEIIQAQYHTGTVNEALVAFVREKDPEIYQRAASVVQIVRPELRLDDGDSAEQTKLIHE